jgi:hypothetical protein
MFFRFCLRHASQIRRFGLSTRHGSFALCAADCHGLESGVGAGGVVGYGYDAHGSGASFNFFSSFGGSWD